MKKISINKIAIHLFLINAFIYISFSLYAPFLSSYYSKAGIDAVEIGVLLTIGPVLSMLVQPLWAIISDRTGRRKDILSFVVFGSAISMFSFYLGNSFLTFFIASTLLAIFNTSIVPLSDAIILRSAHQNQLDFSKIRMGGTIGFAIVVFGAGAVIKLNSNLSFVMGFVGYMILLYFVRRLPQDEKVELPVSLPLPSKKEKKSVFHIFESKDIYFILAFAFISQVGLSFNFSFLGVYIIDMGLSEGSIGLINSVSALSELPVLFLINHIIRRIRSRHLSILACLLLSLRILTMTGGSLPFVVISQALHGLTFITVYFSCAIFISKNVKPENQSKGQSILAIIQTGIGSIVGNILGGLLVDSFGLKQAYTTMTVIIIVVAGLIALLQFLYQRKQKSIETILLP